MNRPFDLKKLLLNIQKLVSGKWQGRMIRELLKLAKDGAS